MKKLFLIITCAFSLTINAQEKKVRTIIFFFDGLRPDYITNDVMPNLYAFSQLGCYGKQHHSVFPTVTRVNSSSYSTGSYPRTHGLMGNTVYFPQVNPVKGLNTGEAENLQKIAEATGDHLLTTTSIGEVLEAAGQKMMVFSSGSTGQAFLQNHKVSGGAIINPDMILPVEFKDEVYKTLGAPPAYSKPNTKRHEWVTDALIKFGLKTDGPLVNAIWLSDPDGAAHSDGIGSPAAVSSLKVVDAQFGRIIQTIKDNNLEDVFNIIVSTDHGFITYAGKESLSALLIKEGLKKDSVSQDVIVSEGAVYVKDHDKERIQQIVSLLQQQPWVGGIFTRGKNKGDKKGWVEGTLSFSLIHWDHPERQADILVDRNWNDDKNAAGYAGTAFSRGVAGHGGMSPYEVHIALLAAGPSFKKSYSSELPTSNVDIVPTVLHIHKIPVPEYMDGRVMNELLTENFSGTPLKAKQEITETAVKAGNTTYKLVLQRTVLGKYEYVDMSRVIRSIGN